MNRLNVLFVDASVNYGYCFCASNTKVEFMARGLVEQGVPVTIVNSVVGNKYVSERTVIHKKDVGNVDVERILVVWQADFPFSHILSFSFHFSQFLSILPSTPQPEKNFSLASTPITFKPKHL